jgi:hypothetical protein
MRIFYLLKSTLSGKTSDLSYNLNSYLNNTNSYDVSFDDIELQEDTAKQRSNDFSKTS